MIELNLQRNELKDWAIKNNIFYKVFELYGPDPYGSSIDLEPIYPEYGYTLKGFHFGAYAPVGMVPLAEISRGEYEAQDVLESVYRHLSLDTINECIISYLELHTEYYVEERIYDDHAA